MGVGRTPRRRQSTSRRSSSPIGGVGLGGLHEHGGERTELRVQDGGDGGWHREPAPVRAGGDLRQDHAAPDVLLGLQVAQEHAAIQLGDRAHDAEVVEREPAPGGAEVIEVELPPLGAQAGVLRLRRRGALLLALEGLVILGAPPPQVLHRFPCSLLQPQLAGVGGPRGHFLRAAVPPQLFLHVTGVRQAGPHERRVAVLVSHATLLRQQRDGLPVVDQGREHEGCHAMFLLHAQLGAQQADDFLVLVRHKRRRYHEARHVVFVPCIQIFFKVSADIIDVSALYLTEPLRQHLAV